MTTDSGRTRGHDSFMSAIATAYDGIFYPSLGEARTAVFFDHLTRLNAPDQGVLFDYEPQGYDLDVLVERLNDMRFAGKSPGRYRPDFWLPNQQIFYEKKSAPPDGVQRLKLEAFGAAVEAGLILDFPARKFIVHVGGFPSESQLREPAYGYGLFRFGRAVDSGWLWCRCSRCGRLNVERGGRPWCRCEPNLMMGGAVTLPTFDDPIILRALALARSAFTTGQRSH